MKSPEARLFLRAEDLQRKARPLKLSALDVIHDSASFRGHAQKNNSRKNSINKGFALV